MNAFGDPTIVTPRLVPTPLRVEDADELAAVLEDERLYDFVGCRPPGPGALRERYRRLVAGSPRAEEVWLNWVLRLQGDSRAVGTAQATVVGGRRASVAWVVGAPWQNRGFASEAAVAVVEWLRARGVAVVEAHVHPDHAASAAVARRAGLEPTDEHVEGERVWRAREAVAGGG